MANVNAHDAKKQRENLQASTDRIDLMGIASMLLNSTQQLAKEMAQLLSQTQGAFLTSIKGIGIVLASGVTAEIGDPLVQRSTDRLASYAGIIPKVKQSGGSQGPSITGRVSKRSNHILKDFVVQSAYHIGRFGPKDLKSDYDRRQATGQHADFGMGRRFIRMSMSLMRTSQIYLPPDLRGTNIEPKQRAAYYKAMWPYLRDKWRKADAIQTAFAKDKPLGQWRFIVQKLYGIKLKL